MCSSGMTTILCECFAIRPFTVADRTNELTVDGGASGEVTFAVDKVLFLALEYLATANDTSRNGPHRD
jgi:hypothetical protein